MASGEPLLGQLIDDARLYLVLHEPRGLCVLTLYTDVVNISPVCVPLAPSFRSCLVIISVLYNGPSGKTCDLQEVPYSPSGPNQCGDRDPV
jgi:hypothetical protein